MDVAYGVNYTLLFYLLQIGRVSSVSRPCVLEAKDVLKDSTSGPVLHPLLSTKAFVIKFIKN